ncbi:protein of unknown function [Quadrisphaera granulorum]|uniref:Uncharacterized protein DUF4439 n=1 Tax=Quadrisphaera granulorum TaxID=317664 RepID=A0A316B1L8_9ACTN|nr:DUF4439 domain-containing protein [Quadrisphaera granulorum]PWJ56447.1 uncharacterized protein DUF4439 [Quadrisphaera granulorum]SZE95081.1 protein of unknown function [Quadrisphaera granulorum]
MPTSPSRRAVLAVLTASAAAGLAGCSTPWGRLRVQPPGGDPPPTTPPPGPDELARRAAVSAVTAALVRVGGLDAAHSGPLSAALGEQLAALGETPPPTTPSPTPSATATATDTPTPATPTPATPADVASLLQQAAQTATADLAEVSGGSARLLACLAAGLEVARSWLLGDAAAQPEPSGSGTPSSSSESSSAAVEPSGSSTTAAQSREQGALAAALAVEEAAQYGYGVVAARLSGAQRGIAVGRLAEHEQLVEQLRDDLLALGAQPPAPQPAWTLPSPVTDAASALALAQQLEGASAGAWADVVDAAARQRRAAAAGQVLAAARRWQRWRAEAGVAGLVALPGLSGR